MSATENLAVHTRWSDAEDRHDLSHHGEFIHSDIEFHVPGRLPVAGLDGYLAMMEANYAVGPGRPGPHHRAKPVGLASLGRPSQAGPGG